MIKLTDDELKKVKNKVYIEYKNYIDKFDKKIIPELVEHTFNSKWDQYIDNHPEDLVKGKEEEIIYYVGITCIMFINWIPNDESGQQRILKLIYNT